jgi:mono/diheme cytochrome c family protein
MLARCQVEGRTVNQNRLRRWLVPAAFFLASLVAVTGLLVAARDARAGLFSHWKSGKAGCCADEAPLAEDIGGTWYWLRSPEEEQRVAAGLFNRYCIRCHGVDGRGIWDIPGVPDFTNARWQACRSDAQIARIIMEGRGAVMPPFRGALHLEEAWGLARHIRTLMPGTQASRPDFGPAGNGRPAPEQITAPPTQR